MGFAPAPSTPLKVTRQSSANHCPALTHTVHRVPIGRQELCRTAWALGRLGVGGVYFGGARAGDVGALEDDGVVPEGSGCDDDGSEMSRLMDKLLGECSKWLELFTPQVPVDAPEGHAKVARPHTSGGIYPLDPAPLSPHGPTILVERLIRIERSEVVDEPVAVACVCVFVYVWACSLLYGCNVLKAPYVKDWLCHLAAISAAPSLFQSRWPIAVCGLYPPALSLPNPTGRLPSAGAP